MQMKYQSGMERHGRLAWLWLLIALAVLVAAFWKPLIHVAALCAGAAALAFVAVPFAKWLERRLSRQAASFMALSMLLAATVLLLLLLLPAIMKELTKLAQALPQSVRQLTTRLSALVNWLEAHFPGIQWPEPRFDGMTGLLADLATGTISLAGSAGEALSTLSISFVLGYFFLHDRERMLLRLELLIPLRYRQIAVRMGNAVLRELRLYLRGQLLIALAVGALAAAGLMLIGVRSALVLGGIVGLLNMVPYFGPFIGGIPAVLLALSDGWQKAAMAAGMLIAVQQLDSLLISPRIMGSLSGLSPAAVLVAIFAGARISGIAGMLLALPIFMSVRTVFRVFVQNRENV